MVRPWLGVNRVVGVLARMGSLLLFANLAGHARQMQ